MPEDCSTTNILIVDDEESSRYTLSRYLKRAGYSTWEAKNGAEALALARQRPSLVLLDIHLPDMMGYEVCRIIKADPETASIPVLHVSATFRSSEDKVRGLEGGADGYLNWPVETEELLANIKVLLRLRQTQEALIRSRERLEMSQEAGQIGTFDWDIRSNDVLWSATLQRLYGLSANDGIRTYDDWANSLHPEDRARTEKEVARAVREATALDIEFRIIRPDGAVRWISSKGRVIRDGDGQPLRFMGANIDITERKRWEQELWKRNERLQILSEAMGHLLVTRDVANMVDELFSKIAPHLGLDAYVNFLLAGDGETLVLNSSAGLPEEAVAGLRRIKFDEYLCGSAARGRQPIIASNIQNSTDPRSALLRRLGLRSYISLPLMIGERLLGTLSFASRSRDHFEEDEIQFSRTISHYVAIALERLEKESALREATEDLELQVQKRTQKLQETIQEIETFTYIITHDMRAPLRTMSGFSQLLLEEHVGEFDPESVDYLRRIANAAQRLDALILDVLNYGKIVRAETVLKSVDLDRLLRDIIRDYPAFQKSEAEIQVAGSIPSVLGNEAFLTQIISNLLSNAVKFVSPGTPPHVEIRAEHREGFVRVWVGDNGIGIGPEHRERIFNLFERIHPNHEFTGTGVGLAIVRKAVDRLGGKAGVDSELGKGSRFWIDLRPA